MTQTFDIGTDENLNDNNVVVVTIHLLEAILIWENLIVQLMTSQISFKRCFTARSELWYSPSSGWNVTYRLPGINLRTVVVKFEAPYCRKLTNVW